MQDKVWGNEDTYQTIKELNTNVQDPTKPIWINKPVINNTVNKKPVIFVATPVHDQCSIHYTQSLLKFQQECMQSGILVSFSLLKSSLVTQGRNLSVSNFLEECEKVPYTHFLFIDSDIEFSFKTIMKMVVADKELIAAPYPLKHIDWDKVASRIKTRNIEDGKTMSHHGFTWPVKIEDRSEIQVINGVAEVSHAPTGCMLIKKQVFEKMIKAFPDKRISQPTIINGKQVEKKYFYNFFDTYHEPETKRYYGEDFGFCKRWAEIGGKCHILVDDYITHVGEYKFTGRLMDDLSFTKKID
jgi:hypothetical protein